MSAPTQEELVDEEVIFEQIWASYAREQTPLEKEFNKVVGDAIAQHWPPKEGLPNE
jgi:hypothetical protein